VDRIIAETTRLATDTRVVGVAVPVTPVRMRLAWQPGGTCARTPVRAHEYSAVPGGSPGSSTSRLTCRHGFTVEFEARVVPGLPVGGDAHFDVFGLGQLAPVQEAS
jgi:hypothetical protein